jgi:lipopolysaccharide transport system permease protein
MSLGIQSEESGWDVVLTSKKAWFELHLDQIWRYRDLLMLFVRRDIVSFYKQTIFGPLWYFIQPVFTTIVFTFVFGNLAKLPTDGLPQPLFYMAGIMAWNYFADCLTKTSTIFKDNAAIFGKVYFPRIISPLSIIISNLLRFAIQMLLFIGMVVYFLFQGVEFSIGPEILLFPVFILFMAMQGLGLGMIITSMTTKYKDLSIVLPFGVQLLMFTTTVIYPLSSLSGDMYWIVALNPMTFVIEGIKQSALGAGAITVNTFAYTFFISTLILFLGVLIFNKVEKNFIDTI